MAPLPWRHIRRTLDSFENSTRENGYPRTESQPRSSGSPEERRDGGRGGTDDRSTGGYET